MEGEGYFEVSADALAGELPGVALRHGSGSWEAGSCQCAPGSWDLTGTTSSTSGAWRTANPVDWNATSADQFVNIVM
jgi:hypothetical protein